MTMWTIHLLGALRAHSSLRSVTRFRTQKAASLLAYLAFHPASQPREILIALLWPDAESDVARHNLSNALSFLRHLLEPPGIPPGTVILADRFQVRLNADAITTDVIAFETAVAQAGQKGRSSQERLSLLEQAVQLYEGSLLPGFHDEWIAPQSLRLESLFVQTVSSLISGLLKSGRAESAFSYAQRAATLDPLSDLTTLCVMQALDALGQPAQALRTYRVFARRLQEELGTEPSLAMQSLARRLESGSLPGSTLGVIVSDPLAGNVVTSPHPNLEATLGTDAIRSVSGGRLIGGEFLLRTTTRFFGREEELARLSKMLLTPRIRLVALTGSGGMGKTRLALETAAQLVQRTTDIHPETATIGAVFVPLADVTEAERLFDAILRTLGILPTPGRDPLDQLAKALAQHPDILLVLDNFEHLAEEGALRVRDLLAKVGEVKLLITSRQKLHIEGEREFHLAPLPTFFGELALQESLSVPSVALFVDRAQAALPDFQLTSRNIAVIAQLCDYLEGLPLAIELAAARVVLLSPGRILEQVRANRLDFLATRRRDATSRQRTLRATMDWSYHLLPGNAQECLGKLSVFRGGWTLEAAQAVCALGEAETLELLMLLRDSSLIVVADTEEGGRYTLLETVREYAAEQIERNGEKKAACIRHRDFFLAMAEAAEPHLTGTEQVVWLDRLEREHDNLRSAFDGSVDRAEWGGNETGADISAALIFCGALYEFWSIRGYLAEGRTWCQISLEAEGNQERSARRAKVLNAAGALALSQGDYANSWVYHEESLKIRREVDDRRGIAGSLNDLGILIHHQGDYVRSCAYHEESLAIRREIGDRWGIAGSLSDLGVVANIRGDHTRSRAYHEESLKIRREIGNLRGIAHSLNNLGIVTYEQGDYARSHAYYEESLAIRREIGDQRGIAHSLNNLGIVANIQGDYARAQTYYEESLKIRRQIGDQGGIASVLNNLGIVACEQGDYASGRTYYEESLKAQREIGNRRGVANSLNNLGTVAIVQGDYAGSRAYYVESLTIQHEIGDRRGIAFSLEAFADWSLQAHAITVAIKLAELSGGIVSALRKVVRLWGAAHALRIRIDAALSPTDQKELERKHAIVREILAESEWQRMWEEGHRMPLEQAISYALEGGNLLY